MQRCAWLICVLCALPCAAHPISVTQASVLVHSDRIDVAIELFLEDLYLFHGLEANQQGVIAAADLRATMAKHKEFLLERFTVRDADGELLVGRVDRIDESNSEIPDEGVPITELMAHSLVYHVNFPFRSQSEPPKFLVFSQTLGNTAFGFPAEMLLELKLEGSDVPYQTSLRSNEPVTVPVDWDDPPPSADASQKQWDEWESRRREKTLGIESYSSVYSFLYIEDFEVRHEILVPVLSLEAEIPIQRADPAFLEVSEQMAIKAQIGALFAEKTSVAIDGVVVAPKVDRVDFFGLDFKDFAKSAEPRRLSMFTARVGVILRYSTKGPTTSVDVTWNMFNKFLFASQTIVYAPDKTTQTLLSPYQKTYSWKAAGERAIRPSFTDITIQPPKRRPLVEHAVALGVLVLGFLAAGAFRRRSTLACSCLFVAVVASAASAPVARIVSDHFSSPLAEIDAARANSIFQSLHKNIYRAFDYRDENEIYDALARSIAGPLLEEVYLDVKRQLVMQEQGGALARVTQVQWLDSRPNIALEDNALCVHARWNVRGTVEHWGHIHDRTNQYEATFRLEPTNNAWKITHMDIQRESPLAFTTRLRGLEPDSTGPKADGK